MTRARALTVLNAPEPSVPCVGRMRFKGDALPTRSGCTRIIRSKTAMTDTKSIEAPREALEDEYKARATYRKIIEVFGPVRPFREPSRPRSATRKRF